MTPELERNLKSCKTLPTPPGVAAQIIAEARDPDTDIGRFSNLLGSDPAIAVKVLRLANSPMYGQRRRIESVQQAIIVLGLDATVSLALSFSLAGSWKKSAPKEVLDHELFYRRSILAASVGRMLADTMDVTEAEELFLTCLIQDVGVLALSGSVEGIYAGMEGKQLYQDQLIEHERAQVSADHAEVGGWLLKRWNFPARVAEAVSASHDPDRIPAESEDGRFVRCVALSSMIAETFLDQTGQRRFEAVAEWAERSLGLDGESLGKTIETVASMIPEVEAVFDTQILVDGNSDTILVEARETLELRKLSRLQATLERRLQEQI